MAGSRKQLCHRVGPGKVVQRMGNCDSCECDVCEEAWNGRIWSDSEQRIEFLIEQASTRGTQHGGSRNVSKVSSGIKTNSTEGGGTNGTI